MLEPHEDLNGNEPVVQVQVRDNAAYYAIDRTGNTGVAGPFVYSHSEVTAESLWQNIDTGTPGTYGRPRLTLSGPQTAGSQLTLQLLDAEPNALFLPWLATPLSTPVSALGGTVHAVPYSDEFLLVTDSGGSFTALAVWPPGVPTGTEHTWQTLVGDSTSVFGIALSNAVRGTAP